MVFSVEVTERDRRFIGDSNLCAHCYLLIEEIFEMSKKFSKKPLAIAIGTAVAASFSMAPVANADQNPFGMTDLANGYMEIAEGEKKADGSCGEGKCGGEMKKKMEKKAEGSCGEGKCGEGKCASNKKKEKSEGSCGAKKSEGAAE